jgi:hypothetical protein
MTSRRNAMIRVGQLGLGAITLPGLLGAELALARSEGPSRPQRKAKSCIYIFLQGGPPQQDMWDMKPDAPSGIKSPFAPVRTKVPGIEICELMPLVAQQTEKVAIVRSLTHRSNEHGHSIYHMLTGKQELTGKSTGMETYARTRRDFPFCGSVVAHFSQPGQMPAAVTVPRPLAAYGSGLSGSYAGFLGPRCDPMETREVPEEGTRSQEKASHFSEVLVLPPDVDAGRLQGRVGLRHLLERQDDYLNRQRALKELDAFHEQAFRLVASGHAKRAFNLDLEPMTVRDRYGRNEYGESILLARRLVEAGVRLVTMVWYGPYAGWDVHGAQGGGLANLKDQYRIPPLDRAYSALISDLAERGLLEETLVLVAGEFGRTPKINLAGRDHWGACQSVLLAGGGIRGGQVYGSSDAHAAYPQEKPVAPEDLLATIYDAFGISPDEEIRDVDGRPHRICDGKPIKDLFA